MKKQWKNQAILALALSALSTQTALSAPVPSTGSKTALTSKVEEKFDPSKLVIKNWGIDNSEFPSHISALKAWKIARGKKQIVVAVIDTGIDPEHPDLKDVLCHKKGSDEYGYDFVGMKKNPGDTNGHGTHVSGIVAATAKSRGGAVGVAQGNVCIMPVRYYSDTASGAANLKNTIRAIHYAIDNGADIINYSGGGAEFSSDEYKAIQRAESKGILFVAAAGNEFQNTDESGKQYYPGSYGLSNIITVASTNIKNQLLPSSNWGLKNVHVAAPGENIFSTYPRGRFGFNTGTSQATAFVTGIAAMILSENPGMKPAAVKDVIMKSVDPIKELEKKVVSGGRVNAFAAIQLTQKIAGTAPAEAVEKVALKAVATATPEASLLSKVKEAQVREVAVQ